MLLLTGNDATVFKNASYFLQKHFWGSSFLTATCQSAYLSIKQVFFLLLISGHSLSLQFLYSSWGRKAEYWQQVLKKSNKSDDRAI